MTTSFSNLIVCGTLSAIASVTLAAAAQQPGLLPTTAQVPPSSRLLVSQSTLSPQQLEQAVHTQINQYRASRGLSPLTLDERISQQARSHSQAMANGQVAFGHTGFQQRIQAIARLIPYRSAAENVAYNMGYANPDQQAVKGWLKSPGHLKNIQGQYDLTGIGVVRNAKGEYYFTQIFIRRA